MASTFKLRCSLFGHEKDVRGVCSSYFPEGGFISGSRDVTTRVWVPNEGDAGFTEGHVMSGHNNYVSCVCVMPPSDEYPQGLICTGSHDKTICAYTLDSVTPVFKLEGHNDTVCSLSSGKFGSLLSGSWDTTAKVWLNQKCVMTLSGHEATIWAVAIMPEGGFMLTGSADKTIKMWRAGRCQQTFTGHTDCVRALAVLSVSEFLSAANDATIRRWATTGDNIQVYYGHENYIYSLAVLPNGEDFVSSGEDRTLRVWKEGKCVQTLTHPAQSVWCVCVLSNGDIATGASDCMIRVFSSDPGRAAPEEEQKAYEEQLASATIPTQIGDLKTDDIPGMEALLNPGKKDGQHIMVKDGDKIEAHQWSAAEGRWIKIGDVVGGSSSGEGKKTYQGKEYDYVFDVDIDENKPPLKLPFNTNEDPWMAAHNFLERNDISQMYLDQVVKFILEQTKGVELGPRNQGPSDPFTGGGRYVPGSGPGADSSGGADPFTGAGRYVPSYGQEPAGSAAPHGADPFTGSGSYRPSGAGEPLPVNTFYPQSTYLSFDQANIAAILGKLKEFNGKVGNKMDEAALDQLVGLMNGNETTAQQLDILWKILQWPADSVFPALDVLRLAVRSEAANQHFFNVKDGPAFVEHLLKLMSPDSKPANQMLALRTLCNAFRHGAGESMMISQRDDITVAMMNCRASSNKNVHVAMCSVLLNYAVAFLRNKDVEGKALCISSASIVAEAISDPEAIFRLLVTIGTLLSEDANSAKLVKSLELNKFISKAKGIRDPSKVSDCAKCLEAAL